MAVLISLLACFLVSCSSASFILENGVGQWRLFNRAQPVEQVLASPRVSESVKRSIRIVRKAKEFAVKELGLKATKNYENFVQLDSPCVIWAVSAADPLELKEQKWYFPIVGEVPYLGFFQKQSADQEAARLRTETVPTADTWIRCVPAFSSLGWFPDPLYSSMLKGNERDLVELVVHESLHATVWVKSSVDFNEKLANFVGLEGSLRYVTSRLNAEEQLKAKKEVAGEKLFGDFMKWAESDYLARVKTPQAKIEFYQNLEKSYLRFLDDRPQRNFTPLKVKFTDWNNAAFLAYLNYYSDYSVFEAMLAKCAGDLGRFVRWISQEAEKATGRFESAPEEHLGKVVKESSCAN